MVIVAALLSPSWLLEVDTIAVGDLPALGRHPGTEERAGRGPSAGPITDESPMQ